MSAEINNRSMGGPRGDDLQAFRKEKLKEIIKKLHKGHTVEEVQEAFAAHFGSVSAEEISLAEQALIDEGMPVTEVQRLCDVHAAVFKGSIDEIHARPGVEGDAGHPLNVFKAENKALADLLSSLREGVRRGDLTFLKAEAPKLSGIDSHYKIKENLFFPFLERNGVTGPPKVMWGVDDEIRAEIKQALAELERGGTEALSAALVRVEDMAFKEEHILLPMLIEQLTGDEWRRVADGLPEFGAFLIAPPKAWKGNEGAGKAAGGLENGRLSLPTGDFTVKELAVLLNTLPLDLTFVDKEGRVRYFSQGAERAFPRTLSVLGREVSNCHPPKSVHIVEQIVEDLKAGRKDHEDFWIQMGEKLIHIRYFALRGPEGDYLGVLETTQNIAPLKKITGEKRLMS